MQRKTNPSPAAEQAAYSIEAFCRAHNISRPFLYQCWKRGEGPEVMHIGRRRLITVEAASAWRQKLTRRADTASGQ